jgi:flagellar basal-body rod protein FlgB
MSWLDDPIQRTLSGALDGLALRESLIASNLANIDTPGYAPRSVAFEAVLQAALAEGQARAGSGGSPPSAGTAMLQTDPRHLGAGDSQAHSGPAVATFAGSIRNDGNQVDLESEMAALAETQLRFAAVGRLMTGRLGMLRDAITGGR